VFCTLPELEEDLAELFADLHEGVKVTTLCGIACKVVLFEGLCLPGSVCQHVRCQVSSLLLDSQRELGPL